METYSLMVLFHIFLLVFWLGTDLGVLFAAKMSERSDLSARNQNDADAACHGSGPVTANDAYSDFAQWPDDGIQPADDRTFIAGINGCLDACPDMGHYYVAGFSKPGIQIREKLSPD